MWSRRVICSASSMADRDSKHSAFGLSAWEHTHRICCVRLLNSWFKDPQCDTDTDSTPPTGWQGGDWVHYSIGVTNNSMSFLPQWSEVGGSFSGDKLFWQLLKFCNVKSLPFRALWELQVFKLTICRMSSIFSWASSCSSWERALQGKNAHNLAQRLLWRCLQRIHAKFLMLKVPNINLLPHPSIYFFMFD